MTFKQNILFFDMGAQSTTATIVGYSTMKEKEKSTKLIPGLVIKGVGFGLKLRNFLLLNLIG